MHNFPQNTTMGHIAKLPDSSSDMMYLPVKHFVKYSERLPTVAERKSDQQRRDLSTMDQTDIRGLDTGGQWDRRELASVS